MAEDAQRIERSAHLRQRLISVDEARLNTQEQATVLALADRQQLDRVAQLAAKGDVLRLKRIDAAGGDIALAHGSAEGQRRDDRQLLRCISAGDIERRVRFGEALGLGLLERVGVGPAGIRHLREDVVARAVKDAVEGINAIGGQAELERREHRDRPAARGLEGDGDLVAARQGKQLTAVRRQQRLVGRHHVPAGLQRAGDVRLHRVDSPRRLNEDVDLPVAQQSFGIVGEQIAEALDAA
jgi:hypothetical protein